ncbi:MAG: hypothetical protein VB078_07025 [Clostridiaceae bacterium]|nr:hypothetical protein [Clostridiaceae bacterium]
MRSRKECQGCRYCTGMGTEAVCGYLLSTGKSQMVANRGLEPGEPCRVYKPAEHGRRLALRVKQEKKAEKPPQVKKDPFRRPPRRVEQYKADGTVIAIFESVIAASVATGLTEQMIYRFCNGNRKAKSAYGRRGYSFRYIKEPKGKGKKKSGQA